MKSFKFNTNEEREKQSFADFETELRKQFQFCEINFNCGISYEERMLKDRVIIGDHDKKLQLKLLDGKAEPLRNVIDMCKMYKAANANKVFLDKSAAQSIIQKLKIYLKNEKNLFPVFDYSGIKIFGTVDLKCSELNKNTERLSRFLVVDLIEGKRKTFIALYETDTVTTFG